MSAPTENQSCDAIIIGGGPAGACAGAILGEYGHRVLIIEREKIPPHHIGESLIPFSFQSLERIGMIPKMRASAFQKKYSVTFVQPDDLPYGEPLLAEVGPKSL
jgi:2-polyprenyl-6-methoxyphenol hydroxylase-like FAD-dependent oxidoreductase